MELCRSQIIKYALRAINVGSAVQNADRYSIVMINTGNHN